MFKDFDSQINYQFFLWNIKLYTQYQQPPLDSRITRRDIPEHLGISHTAIDVGVQSG